MPAHSLLPESNGEQVAEPSPAAERPAVEPNRMERFASLAGAAADPAPNPFRPENLRLSQDFAAGAAVKKVLTVVPCRKPNKHEFIRVRPGEAWRLETAMFEDRVNRESYLVERALWQELAGEIHPVCVFTAITKQADVFLWPCKLPTADGKSNTWNDSALAAARLAESRWVRVASNLAAGMYDAYEALGELAEPTWPDLEFSELLRLCFKDRFISSADHPVLRALRGEV